MTNADSNKDDHKAINEDYLFTGIIENKVNKSRLIYDSSNSFLEFPQALDERKRMENVSVLFDSLIANSALVWVLLLNLYFAIIYIQMNIIIHFDF